MMMWGYGYSWPMMLWMFFWNFFWLVLLGLAVWALIRWLGRSAWHGEHRDLPSAEPSALEILQRRYARGEIDATTFEQMRERLEASVASKTPSEKQPS
jgi:Predicted membrane protein